MIGCRDRQWGEEVRRSQFLSDCSMDVTRRDIELLVEMCRRNGFTAKQTWEFICKAWGDDAVSVFHVHHLYKEFKEGRLHFDDLPRPGRLML